MKTNSNSSKKTCCTNPPSFPQAETQAIAGQLKALAHPARLQILQYLGNRENCCCNDFYATIPLAQSTISQHLKILNDAGIIDYKRAGNCSHYSLNPDALGEALQALVQIRQFSDDQSPNEPAKPSQLPKGTQSRRNSHMAKTKEIE